MSNFNQLPNPIQELLKDMVLVEGGTFTMGSDDIDDNYDAKPTHHVSLDTYHIAKYPITQAQWKAVMNNNNPSHFQGNNLPVDSVSWNDAQAFISQLNELLKMAQKSASFRLPTEAEWEYAARGGNLISKVYKKYAGSNNIDEVAWYDGNSGNKTHPVGQKRANKLGLHDMSGNVFEWCNDWYAGDYYNNIRTENPTGPKIGTERVLRGGSCSNDAQYCRVAYRISDKEEHRNSNFGVRLVLGVVIK